MGTREPRKKVSWPDVTSRILAAAFGGYAVTYAATARLTLLMPLAKSEAVLTAAMVSFVIYTRAILWAFAAATPAKAWIGLAVPAALCAALAFPLASALHS
jgi:hypothetical protein